MAEAQANAQEQPAVAETALTRDEFQQLLQKEFRPQTDAAKSAIERSVQTLAEQALANTALVSTEVVKFIEAAIAEIDKRLSEQINKILHHPDFQQLEGAWRGLHHLVNNTETDELLKIKVFNITKKELHKNLKRFKGTAWDQSPLFKKVYEQEYGTSGGEPFVCIIGDYYFDQSPPDVELLGEMAKVAAASHTPFIAGVSPSLMQMQSWQELANPRDLTKIFQTPEYAAWRSLRVADESRYIGLAMPRFLARLPYGAKTDPVEEFDFEKETEGADHAKYCWANSAYAMATNITRSYKLYGWCSRIRGIESGGAVEGLPVHTFPTDDGGVDMKCPTEIAITERREAELAKNGFMPLVHKKNSDFAAFIGAQSLQKPAEYDDPDAIANANLSARLPSGARRGAAAAGHPGGALGAGEDARRGDPGAAGEAAPAGSAGRGDRQPAGEGGGRDGRGGDIRRRQRRCGYPRRAAERDGARGGAQAACGNSRRSSRTCKAKRL